MLVNREVKLYRPRYDPVMGNFLGLYEILGYIMVRGIFLEYVLCKQNSKILYSYYKKRIPSLFRGNFFNHQKMMFETGILQTTFSNIFYFLSSTTDRSKEINKYLNLSP